MVSESMYRRGMYTISILILNLIILQLFYCTVYSTYMHFNHVIINMCHHCSGNHMIIIITYPIIIITIYLIIIIKIHLCHHNPGDHTTVKSKRSKSSSSSGLATATESYERYFELYKDYAVRKSP
jgi:hypothetical protein